jgi:hypothetical protein
VRWYALDFKEYGRSREQKYASGLQIVCIGLLHATLPFPFLAMDDIAKEVEWRGR